MGADHMEWARSRPRSLTSIDLTPRAIEHTRKRLAIYGLESDLHLGDAERLNFDDASFDLVYSWVYFTIHQIRLEQSARFCASCVPMASHE